MTPQKQKKGDKTMNKKTLATIASIALAILIITPRPTWGVMVMNQIECPFKSSDEKSTIREYIIEGSNHFLISNSFVYQLLNEYEKAENTQFGFEIALSYTDKAIEKLEVAKVYYEYAKDIGNRIGYNVERLSLFGEFDYNSYIYKNSLNKDIAYLVKSYLQKGDIIGLHNKNIQNLSEILLTLYEIKAEISKKNKPKKEAMWVLLGKYTHAVMFGNIATQFGNAVLDSDAKCED